MNGKKSSGTYVIDEDYTIVTFNQTAEDLYPMLVRGEKCYKCLMNGEKPCEVCPVDKGIKGPRTYLDPIRGIYEMVDAVDMPLADGRSGYALIFSTTDESTRGKPLNSFTKRQFLRL